MAGINVRFICSGLIITLIFSSVSCQGDGPDSNRDLSSSVISDPNSQSLTACEYEPVNAMLVLPKNPAPGEPFRILSTGGENIRKAKILVTGPSGNSESLKTKIGEESP